MLKHAMILAVACGTCLMSQVTYAQQSVVFNAGGFFPRGINDRPFDDVLVANYDRLAFEVSDFNAGTVGGEWLVGMGDFFDAGVGVSFYRRTVTTFDLDFFDADGSDVVQDMRLRIAPVTAPIRVLPFGRQPVEPYFGAGVGVFNWRYSEAGEFVGDDQIVFEDEFVDNGSDVGGVLLGGVRVSMADQIAVGGELRYRFANGRFDAGHGFLADEIDLSGLSALFTLQVKF